MKTKKTILVSFLVGAGLVYLLGLFGLIDQKFSLKNNRGKAEEIGGYCEKLYTACIEVARYSGGRADCRKIYFFCKTTIFG